MPRVLNVGIECEAVKGELLSAGLAKDEKFKC